MKTFRTLLVVALLVAGAGSALAVPFDIDGNSESPSQGTVRARWKIELNPSGGATSYRLKSYSLQFLINNTFGFCRVVFKRGSTVYATLGLNTAVDIVFDSSTLGGGIQVGDQVYMIDAGGGWQAGPTVTWTGPITYKVSFRIPANPTAYPVTYKFMQGTTEVASLTQQPKAAAQTFDINGLSSNEQVYMVEWTGTLSRNEFGTIVFTPLSNWQVVNVGSPVVSGGGSTPIDGAPEPLGPPASQTPTTPTTAPSAPTPTPAPTAPTPTPQTPRNPATPPPNPTPSGSGGATKEDLERQTNQLVAAINDASDEVNKTGNGILTAVNNANTTNVAGQTSIVNAINNANAKAAETGAAQLTAANKLQASADQGNAKLEAIRANTQATASAVTNLRAYMEARDSAAQAQATSSASTGAAAMASKKAEAEAAFNSSVPGVGSISSAAQAKPNIFMINAPGLPAINTDPFESEYAGFIAWLRAIIAFFVAGFLTWWLYGELSQYLMFSATLAPAKGNTVAGSGGQITSAIVAAWITLVLLALPTAFSALWTAAPILPASGTINPFAGATSTAAQGALYLLWGFVPVETILSAVSTAFVVKKAGMQIYFGVAAAIRWAIA